MERIQLDVSYGGEDKQIVILSVFGCLDITTAAEIENKLEDLLSGYNHKIVLNLANIELISIAGWGVLLWAVSEIEQNHGELVLVNMAPHVYAVYKELGLQGILRSFSSVEEAVSSLMEGRADKAGVQPWRNRFLGDESVKRKTSAA